MKDYKYTLEPYNGMKSRYRCPNCSKQKVFTQYIDLDISEHLNDVVGCCNRLIKCGYHYKPKQYFDDNNISFDTTVNHKVTTRVKPKPKPKTSFISHEVLQKSITTQKDNCFIEFLSTIWDIETAKYLAHKYNIGTSKLWSGATVFWQVDINNKIRSGKIMLYNPSKGKRVKEPYNNLYQLGA